MKSKFRYKAWANAEILDSMSKLDLSAAFRARDTGAASYEPHIRGGPYFCGAPGRDGARIPRHEHARHAYPRSAPRTGRGASDDWYQQYVGRVRDDELRERIPFAFTDGDGGCMTREEMLFHVLVHGAYHRGNVGMILTSCGIGRPNDTFTRFLHLSESERREAT